MSITILIAMIVVLTAGGVSGQMPLEESCPAITELMLESVISQSFPTKNNLSLPTVNVLDFHLVCVAHSQERNRYRYISAVVEYICTGNANCPSGTAVEQIHSECSGGIWRDEVAGIGRNIRTANFTANFSTTKREDCAFCFSPTAAAGLGYTTDTVTHCVGCDSACTEGLVRCYNEYDTDCCQYYYFDRCVDTCPNPLIPDKSDDYNCVCPPGFTSLDCSQQCTTNNCLKCDRHPDLCEECAEGYMLANKECVSDSEHTEEIIGGSVAAAISVVIIVVVIIVFVFRNRIFRSCNKDSNSKLPGISNPQDKTSTDPGASNPCDEPSTDTDTSSPGHKTSTDAGASNPSNPCHETSNTGTINPCTPSATGDNSNNCSTTSL